MGGLRRRRSRHDPGRTLRDLAVMVADGGDCLADLRAQRDQPTLFGEVAVLDATAWRALAALDGERVAALRRAPGDGAGACLGAGGSAAERVILDLDATLVTAHSDKASRPLATTSTASASTRCSAYEAETEEALRRRPPARQRRRQHGRRPHHGARCCRRAVAGASAWAGPARPRRARAARLPMPSSTTSSRVAFGLGRFRPDRAGPRGGAGAVAGAGPGVRQLTQAGEKREGAAVAEPRPRPLALAGRGRARSAAASARTPGAQLSFQRRQRLPFQVFITNQQGRRIERLRAAAAATTPSSRT